VLKGRHGLRTEAIDREWERFRRDAERGNLQQQLARVAAFEHVIYAVADWYEKATAIHGRVHPEFHRLLLWHAMEETEHTAVVFDMYQHIYGDTAGAYRKRVEALLQVTRIGARALFAARQAVFAQLAERTTLRPSRIRSWKSFLREASRYTGDYAGFFAPNFSPLDKAPDTTLLPALREQMAPAIGHHGDGWLRLRVVSARDVADDVRAYELAAADGTALPEWSAGAHLDVEIETGIVRPYSLCGDPADREGVRCGCTITCGKEARSVSALRATTSRFRQPKATRPRSCSLPAASA
jgi:hypothetical protein